MSEYRAITITQGSGGFGGPLTVEPKEGKDVLLYITGGGAEPDILPKIVELTGCRPVNGFKTSVPEEEIFLVIIDCGGTLRCGIYPQKRSISTQLENLDQWQNILQKIFMYLVLKMITLHWQMDLQHLFQKQHLQKKKKTSNTAQIRKYLKQWEAHQNQALSRKLVWELVKSLLLSIVQRKNLQTQYFIRSFHSWDSYHC